MNEQVASNRRQLLQTVAATALIATGASNAAEGQSAREKPSMIITPAFESQSTLKPLPFDPAKLSGLSERMMRSHWENNYGGSIKALSTVKKHLSEAQANKDTPPYICNDLQREHLLRAGSVVFHKYYFGNLGGNGHAAAREMRRDFRL